MKRNSYLIGWWWGINKITNWKHLAWCPGHGITMQINSWTAYQPILEVECSYYSGSIQKDPTTPTLFKDQWSRESHPSYLCWVSLFHHFDFSSPILHVWIELLSNGLDNASGLLNFICTELGKAPSHNFPPTLSPYPTNPTLVILWETCCIHLQCIRVSLWGYGIGRTWPQTCSSPCAFAPHDTPAPTYTLIPSTLSIILLWLCSQLKLEVMGVDAKDSM